MPSLEVTRSVCEIWGESGCFQVARAKLLSFIFYLLGRKATDLKWDSSFSSASLPPWNRKSFSFLEITKDGNFLLLLSSLSLPVFVFLSVGKRESRVESWWRWCGDDDGRGEGGSFCVEGSTSQSSSDLFKFLVIVCREEKSGEWVWRAGASVRSFGPSERKRGERRKWSLDDWLWQTIWKDVDDEEDEETGNWKSIGRRICISLVGLVLSFPYLVFGEWRK